MAAPGVGEARHFDLNGGPERSYLLILLVFRETEPIEVSEQGGGYLVPVDLGGSLCRLGEHVLGNVAHLALAAHQRERDQGAWLDGRLPVEEGEIITGHGIPPENIEDSARSSPSAVLQVALE